MSLKITFFVQLIEPYSPLFRQSLFSPNATTGGHLSCCVFLGPRVVLHRTVHRYTVRKKQGRSQLSQDATGSHAQSAGAEIRRYNQKMLEDGIKELFREWREAFLCCSHILYYAPGRNRNLIIGPHPLEESIVGCYDAVNLSKQRQNSLFSRDDPRLVPVPILTRRPTVAEAIRVHATLSTVIRKVASETDFVPTASPITTSATPMSTRHSETMPDHSKVDNKSGITKQNIDTPTHASTTATKKTQAKKKTECKPAENQQQKIAHAREPKKEQSIHDSKTVSSKSSKIPSTTSQTTNDAEGKNQQKNKGLRKKDQQQKCAPAPSFTTESPFAHFTAKHSQQASTPATPFGAFSQQQQQQQTPFGGTVSSTKPIASSPFSPFSTESASSSPFNTNTPFKSSSSSPFGTSTTSLATSSPFSTTDSSKTKSINDNTSISQSPLFSNVSRQPSSTMTFATELTCAYCGRPIPVYQKVYEKLSFIYCSQECLDKHFRELIK